MTIGTPARSRELISGTPAPDYVEPVIGWRCWAVVRNGANFRLRSIAFMDVWPVRQELAARCYDPRSHLPLRLFRRGRQHSPGSVNCTCGIHASSGLAGAAGYLDLYDDVPQLGICHRALGRVALWGTVVEGELGWRASRAYPQRIFLPSEGAKGVRPEAVQEGLSVYGVPVEVIAGNRKAFVDQAGDAVEERKAPETAKDV